MQPPPIAFFLPGFVPGMPGPFELLVIAGIVLLLFGKRLPSAMRSLGQSIVEFKKGVNQGQDEESSESTESRSKTDADA